MHDESHLFLIEKKNVLKYVLKLLNNNDFCLIYMKHNLITVKQKHLGHFTDLIANNRTIGIISFPIKSSVIFSSLHAGVSEELGQK